MRRRFLSFRKVLAMNQTSGLVRLALVALESTEPTGASHKALIDLATRALDEIDRLNVELDNMAKRQGGRYLSPQECADTVAILEDFIADGGEGLDNEQMGEYFARVKLAERLVAVLSR